MKKKAMVVADYPSSKIDNLRYLWNWKNFRCEGNIWYNTR